MVTGYFSGIIDSGLPVRNYGLFPDGFSGMEEGREQ